MAKTRGRRASPSPNAGPRAGVTLAWAGRAWAPEQAGEDRSCKAAGAVDARAELDVDVNAAPSLVEIERYVDARGGASSRDVNRLIRGDALDVARTLAGEGLAGAVDLVYMDPPFASQADYTSEARLDGPADGRVRRSAAYEDSWRRSGEDGVGEYLDMLAPRLEAASRLVSKTGTLWVHLDWRAAYLVRVLLDEIFGRERFVNEIVWRRAPNLGRQAASGQFGRTIDTLLVYGGANAKVVPPTRMEPIEKRAIRWDEEGRPFTSAPRGDYTDASIARLEGEGRVLRTASGRVYVKYFLVKNEEGEWCRERRIDTLWTDVPPLRHAPAHERTGYPTQKPIALLQRIVRAATPERGLVVDLFAGSGTTGDAAHALGRRFILGDAGPVAIATARARLLRAGAPFVLQSLIDGKARRRGTSVGAGVGVEVEVVRARTGEVTVRLVAPAEPLAWAVGPANPSLPFIAAWHSERKPGTKPVPAANVAVLAGVTGAIAVRVYGDDGAVTTRVVPLSAFQREPKQRDAHFDGERLAP